MLLTKISSITGFYKKEKLNWVVKNIAMNLWNKTEWSKLK